MDAGWVFVLFILGMVGLAYYGRWHRKYIDKD